LVQTSQEPAPPSQLVAFGDVPVRFESADRKWLGFVERRYGSFRDASAGTPFVVRFEPTDAALPERLPTPLAVHLEALRMETTRNGYRVRSETTLCEIDLDGRRARLQGPSAMYPLDNVLRHLLPLLWEAGVIVHAAALKDSNGRGLLACGPSGAGKSTIAALAGARALSDELAAVRLGLGEEGNVLVSLPFWTARPGRASLAAILFLGHGDSHRLVPLSREAALKRLATQILWPVWDETATERSFDHLVRIVETTPAFDLSFTPDGSVVRFLEEEVP
jgi:hypothetical protein